MQCYKGTFFGVQEFAMIKFCTKTSKGLPGITFYMTQEASIQYGVCIDFNFLAGQEEKVECKDKNPSCRDWAQVLNDCHLPSVKKDCPVSCNVNKCANKACVDLQPSCPSWANKLKHCHIESVRNACPKSCNLCIKGEIIIFRLLVFDMYHLILG